MKILLTFTYMLQLQTEMMEGQMLSVLHTVILLGLATGQRDRTNDGFQSMVQQMGR